MSWGFSFDAASQTFECPLLMLWTGTGLDAHQARWQLLKKRENITRRFN